MNARIREMALIGLLAVAGWGVFVSGVCNAAEGEDEKGKPEAADEKAKAKDGEARDGDGKKDADKEEAKQEPPPAPLPGDERVAAPDSKDVKKARKAVRKAREEEYEETNLEKRFLLARGLLDSAFSAGAGSVEQYALFEEATELAAETGNVRVAAEAPEGLGEFFEIDRLARRLEALEDVAKDAKTRETLADLTGAFVDLAWDAVREERGELAEDAADEAYKAAKDTRLDSLADEIKDVRKGMKDFADLCSAFERSKKKYIEDPKDERANETIGWYLCVGRGAWEKGLPLLKKADDRKLTPLAEKDLSNPDDPAVRYELAETYWEKAMDVRDPVRRQLQRRAAYWYAEAKDGVDAGKVARAELRIKQVEMLDATRPGLLRWYKKGGGPASIQHGPIDYFWGEGSPEPGCGENNFHVVWEGHLPAEETGTYVFNVQSDDGSRVIVDEAVVVNNWELHAMEWEAGETILTEGWHEFKVEMYEAGGKAGVKIHWVPEGEKREPLPMSIVRYDRALAIKKGAVRPTLPEKRQAELDRREQEKKKREAERKKREEEKKKKEAERKKKEEAERKKKEEAERKKKDAAEKDAGEKDAGKAETK